MSERCETSLAHRLVLRAGSFDLVLTAGRLEVVQMITRRLDSLTARGLDLVGRWRRGVRGGGHQHGGEPEGECVSTFHGVDLLRARWESSGRAKREVREIAKKEDHAGPGDGSGRNSRFTLKRDPESRGCCSTSKQCSEMKRARVVQWRIHAGSRAARDLPRHLGPSEWRT